MDCQRPHICNKGAWDLADLLSLLLLLYSLCSLPSRLATVVSLRHGLTGSRSRSFAEIGECLGCTGVWPVKSWAIYKLMFNIWMKTTHACLVVLLPLPLLFSETFGLPPCPLQPLGPQSSTSRRLCCCGGRLPQALATSLRSTLNRISAAWAWKLAWCSLCATAGWGIS